MKKSLLCMLVTSIVVALILIAAGMHSPATSQGYETDLCPYTFNVRGVERVIYLPCPPVPRDCALCDPVTKQCTWIPCPVGD